MVLDVDLHLVHLRYDCLVNKHRFPTHTADIECAMTCGVYDTTVLYTLDQSELPEFERRFQDNIKGQSESIAIAIYLLH